MKYLLTGGGTGGHVYPGLAVAEELAGLDPEAKFLYVGVKGRAEEKLVPEAGLPLKIVTAVGMPVTKAPLALLRFIFLLGLGVLKASWILLKWKPDVVVGTGGYASAPILLAVTLLSKLRLFRVGSLIHEQNAVPGKLNCLVAQWASIVASTYPSALPYLKGGRAVLSGYPVRKGISAPISKSEARMALEIVPEAVVLLAFGGSLGSRSINRCLVGALPSLLEIEDLVVIHGTGRTTSSEYDPIVDTDDELAKLSSLPDGHSYLRHDYLEPMALYISAADLVVCRAGAGALNELCAAGKAALVIPKANLPGDHQVKNAMALQAAGAVEVLYEQSVRGETGVVEMVSRKELVERVGALITNPNRLKQLGSEAQKLATPQAARFIAEMVFSLAEHRPVDGNALEMDQWPVLPERLENFSRMSGAQLLKELNSMAGKGMKLSSFEKRYLAYRTDGYLVSPSWELRNLGVKLIGLLDIKERSLLLSSLVYEPKSHVGFWGKMFGSRFRENDFVRRNSLISLAGLGDWNPHVRRALIVGLTDRYFEVKTASAKAIGGLAQLLSRDEEILRLLRQLLRDPRFEVREAALLAIGEVAEDRAWVQIITPFFMEHNWKVRAAALNALRRMVERGQLTVGDMPHLMEKLHDLLLTSTGFEPIFELKRSLLALTKVLEEL